jgi:hypothetical protein
MLGYKRGMETELKDQRVPVMMSASEVKAVDAWRRSQDDLPSRGEAIRRLIEFGLKTPPEPPTLSALADYYKRIGKPDLAEAVLAAGKDIKP